VFAAVAREGGGEAASAAAPRGGCGLEWHSASFARKACMLVCKVLGVGRARRLDGRARSEGARGGAAVRGRRGRESRAGAEA